MMASALEGEDPCDMAVDRSGSSAERAGGGGQRASDCAQRQGGAQQLTSKDICQYMIMRWCTNDARKSCARTREESKSNRLSRSSAARRRRTSMVV
jgi:hypothetical protein